MALVHKHPRRADILGGCGRARQQTQERILQDTRPTKSPSAGLSQEHAQLLGRGQMLGHRHAVGFKRCISRFPSFPFSKILLEPDEGLHVVQADGSVAVQQW